MRPQWRSPALWLGQPVFGLMVLAALVLFPSAVPGDPGPSFLRALAVSPVLLVPAAWAGARPRAGSRQLGHVMVRTGWNLVAGALAAPVAALVLVVVGAAAVALDALDAGALGGGAVVVLFTGVFLGPLAGLVICMAGMSVSWFIVSRGRGRWLVRSSLGGMLAAVLLTPVALVLGLDPDGGADGIGMSLGLVGLLPERSAGWMWVARFAAVAIVVGAVVLSQHTTRAERGFKDGR